MNKEENVSPNKPKQQENRSALYWSRAKKLNIANFQKEKRDAGHIVEVEKSIVFDDHILMTDDPVKIECIEKSNAFKNGDCRLVKDMNEAISLTNMLNAKRGVTTIKSEDIINESVRM